MACACEIVLDGDDVVGFIRGNFDPDNPKPEFRSCIWRINVDATAQGRGIGKFAVHALADEARQRGFDTVTVIWETGEEGPGEFFRRSKQRTKKSLAEVPGVTVDRAFGQGDRKSVV